MTTTSKARPIAASDFGDGLYRNGEYLMIPAPQRTREQLADALTITGAHVLKTSHATHALHQEVEHGARRGALRFRSLDASRSARTAYLSFVELREEVLQATAPWDRMTERRAA